MNTLLAIAFSFTCTGYGLIQVGIDGSFENFTPTYTAVNLVDLTFPVDPSHIEKYEVTMNEKPHVVMQIRNPEKPEEFFHLKTEGEYGEVTFDYKGVRMTEQPVTCEYSE